MGQIRPRTDKLDIISDDGTRKTLNAGKGGSIPVRTVKKSSSGGIQFVSASDAKGTKVAGGTSFGTGNTPTVTTGLSLTEPANYVQAKLNLTGGSAGGTLQIEDDAGGVKASTGITASITTTITANLEALSPKVKLNVTSIAVTSLTINTLSCLANDIATENIIPA